MADSDFLVKKKNIDPDNHVIVRYKLETSGDFESAAIALSKEQSFSAIEDPDKEKVLTNKYAAKVIMDSIGHAKKSRIPAMPSFVHGNYKGTFSSQEVELAFPEALFGGSLVAMLNMAIGEVHNIARFTGIKVIDVTVPKKWLARYKGPAFGIEGIRKIIGKRKGPILISPVKPCVGLSPDEFADRVYECLMGGFDGVKDDELLLDPPYCRFRERVRKTMRRVREVEQRTGRKRIYFTNVGGDVGEIDDMVEFALKEGVGGIMFSPLVNGFDILQKYRGSVPIIAHNNLTYSMARHPLLGVSYALYAKLQRLCGADVAICPAPTRSFYVMDMETHRQNVAVCTEKNGLKMTLAGLSGSQTPETLYQHGVFLGHSEYAICPGGAVYEHPLGIQAGAQSFVESVEALLAGISLKKYAKDHESLRVSLQHFGRRTTFDR